MTTPVEVQTAPKTDDAEAVEIIEHVNDMAEEAIGLGCGDDNPYH